MITQDLILKALSNVQEPDLNKDLVSLNMIKNLQIQNNTVSFDLELTTPACPMKDMMKQACQNAIHHLVDKNILINISFTSKPKNTQPNQQPSNIKNIIAVFSGKGGVGKSTVASNLAIFLSKQGAKVGLMDADIYGPSIPIMFGVQDQRPLMHQVEGKNKIIPIQKHDIFLMSIGLLIDEKQAVVWRGPMASSAIRQFTTDVDWGELDYLVIDMPPGTGDIHLSILQLLPLSGAVIVTTPQQVALADAKKAIAMFAQAQTKVPIIGIVENMAYFSPKELPNNQYFIFGKDGGKKLASDFEIPFLGQIPITQTICEAGDKGNPFININQPHEKEFLAFQQIAQNTIRSLAMYQQNVSRQNIAQTIQ